MAKPRCYGPDRIGDCPIPADQVGRWDLCEKCDTEYAAWFEVGSSRHSVETDPECAQARAELDAWHETGVWVDAPSGEVTFWDEVTPRATGIGRGMGAVDGFDEDLVRNAPPGLPLQEER